MAILVTGGTGFIGSHTCIALTEAGYDAVIVDNYYNSSPKSLERINELCGKELKFYECDIRDREGMTRVFKDNNIGGTLTLCEVMRDCGCKNIVFSSSATVYGMHNVSPLKETMPAGGTTNPYGTTKYMIEIILEDIYKADNDWNVTLLRYFNPIGAHKSGRIGENPNGIPNNLMPYITQVAVGKLPELSIYGDDYDTKDGTGVRDYIHVVDLAEGHVKALDNILSGKRGVQIFNLGTGVGYSVLDIVHAFEEANGVKIPYKIVGRRPGDIATCYSDPTKAKEVLGWQAKRGLAEMCEDSWRWQKQNPNGFE